MTTVSQLRSQAESAGDAGRYREAILLFRQAAEEAAKLGDRVAWFENLVWAADCAVMLHEIPLAQRLLLEARADEPSGRSDYLAMKARKRFLDITFAYRPVLSRIKKQLEDFRAFSQISPVPPADLECLAARLVPPFKMQTVPLPRRTLSG